VGHQSNVTFRIVCLAGPGLTSVVPGSIPQLQAGSNTNSPIGKLFCNTGYLMATGGMNSGYGTVVYMQDDPISTTGWQFEIYNPTVLTIYAGYTDVCMAAPGLVSQIVSTNLSATSGHASALVTATCPSGYVAAGGGINTGYHTTSEMVDAPVSATSWQAQLYNYGPSTISAQLEIVCLR